MNRFIVTILVTFCAFMFVGCGNDFREIPAGYVAKILTPTGWQNETKEAGQVDISSQSTNGSYNTLVLLEATSYAIKESFQQANANSKEDDRMIVNKIPVTADIYIRVMIPVDPKIRNACFAQVTARPVQGLDREKEITVQMVYDHFAKMDVRSGCRAIIQKETDVDYIMKHLEEINGKLGAMVVKLFDKNGVPLLVQNVALSNFKVDESIWEAENQKNAALSQMATIDSIGRKLNQYPQYLEFKKLETWGNIAKDNKGNVSFTVISGQPAGIVIPAANK